MMHFVCSKLKHELTIPWEIVSFIEQTQTEPRECNKQNSKDRPKTNGKKLLALNPLGDLLSFVKNKHERFLRKLKKFCSNLRI